MYEQRVDAATNILNDHIAQHVDFASLGVHGDVRHVRAIRVGQLVGAEIGRGLEAWLVPTVGTGGRRQGYETIEIQERRSELLPPGIHLTIPELQTGGLPLQSPRG